VDNFLHQYYFCAVFDTNERYKGWVWKKKNIREMKNTSISYILISSTGNMMNYAALHGQLPCISFHFLVESLWWEPPPTFFSFLHTSFQPNQPPSSISPIILPLFPSLSYLLYSPSHLISTKSKIHNLILTYAVYLLIFFSRCY